MTRLAMVVSTVLYIGYVPVAPGTMGSVAGLCVFALVRAGGSVPGELATIVGLGGLGVWTATVAERYLGRRDPGAVVIDEVVGMLVTLVGVSVSWMGALAGFVLFRLFDVVKPFPARAFERLPGGWGVMADDLMAGLYAHVALLGLAWLLPGWIA